MSAIWNVHCSSTDLNKVEMFYFCVFASTILSLYNVFPDSNDFLNVVHFYSPCFSNLKASLVSLDHRHHFHHFLHWYHDIKTTHFTFRQFSYENSWKKKGRYFIILFKCIKLLTPKLIFLHSQMVNTYV